MVVLALPAGRFALPAAAVLSFLLAARSPGSTPGSGEISPASPPLVWTGFPAIAAASESEGTCVEGVNCDAFTLTVSGTPADWAGKVIRIRIDWSNAANDFDLFVHQASNAGPLVGVSAAGPFSTGENTTVTPFQSGTGVYTVHVVYFAVANDTYQGTASVALERSAIYVEGGIAFSPSVALRAPAALASGEPSSRCDGFGNFYAGGIRGVPAGTDVWYVDLRPGSSTYDPWVRSPDYLGVPESIPQDQAFSVGADGGGDIDFAVGFGGSEPAFLAGASLLAANVSAFRSLDRGATFEQNPVGSMVPVDDRQWLEAFGSSSTYLYYRTISVPTLHSVQRSDDAGLTYGPPAFVGTGGQSGNVDVDQATGIVYASRQATTQVSVARGVPPSPGEEPVTYSATVAATDPAGVDQIFAPVKVAPDGTVYVVYSNGKDVLLVHSCDQAQTWSLPVRVNHGPLAQTNLMPWIETGSVPDSVGIVWYGTASGANADEADWNVFFAQSLDATSATPTFRQVLASDHVVHAGNISVGGLLGSANRNLLDYFQLAIDPTGAAVIAYTDDHNDLDGHSYVTRQVSGPGLHGAPVPAPGPQPPPVPPPADGAQTSDFAQDHLVGLLATTPTASPFDILSIRWSCEESPSGRLLVGTMEVSDLPAATPPGNWRIYFSANAPDSVLSPTGEYTFGRWDRGDIFWFRASTANGPPAFTFGTAARTPTGGISRTTRGSADAGSIDPATERVTVKVLLARLNAFLPTGHAPIGGGSTLVGLIGESFSADGNAVVDLARGGRQFTLPSTCPATGAPPPPPPPPTVPIEKVTGGGSILGKVVSFAFKADANLSGHLSYRDAEEGIHLVSDRFLTFVQTGPNRVEFSGTGKVGGNPVTFEVTAEDGGGAGTDDFFAIDIAGSVVSTRGGNLSTGTIQVHR